MLSKFLWSLIRLWCFLASVLKKAGVKVADVFFVVRRSYLQMATVGSWGSLSRITGRMHGDLYGLRDEFLLLKEEVDRTVYRLDELMRILELEKNIVIPSTIEGPRLTVYGAGIEIGDEGRIVERAVEAERVSQEEAQAESALFEAEKAEHGEAVANARAEDRRLRRIALMSISREK